MKNITIDCKNITDKEAFHRVLADAFCFPDWYGHNLDALYDCLTDLEEESYLTLQNWTHIAGWAATFRAVLEEAESEVLELTVTFE